LVGTVSIDSYNRLPVDSTQRAAPTPVKLSSSTEQVKVCITQLAGFYAVARWVDAGMTLFQNGRLPAPK
jgi:hypothetical protein